jgi:hypothetical protein
MVSHTPPAKSFFSPNSILLTALLNLACGSVIAQTASADYTSDLPSVERVKVEIKGSDDTDTLARQVAVFTYLQAYVERIKYNRTVSGPYTPGEQRVIAAYSLPPTRCRRPTPKPTVPTKPKPSSASTASTR